MRFFENGNKVLISLPNGQLKLWDTNSGKLLKEFRQEGTIFDLAIGKTQGMFATGGEDGVLRLWNLDDQKMIREFKAHSEYLQAIDFHPTQEHCIHRRTSWKNQEVGPEQWKEVI